MQKRASKRRQREQLCKIMSVIASVLIPPLGIYLVWRARWTNNARYCLTGLAVGCMALMVALLPSPDARVNGGIELVGRKPEAEIYGPDLPTAKVAGYVAPVAQSVFVQDDGADTLYVYATHTGQYYHLKDCQYAYASAQKMTVYEAHFLGYLPCTLCNAPAYVEGSM